MNPKKENYKKIKDKPTGIDDRLTQLEELVDQLVHDILEKESEITRIKKLLKLS